MPMYFVTHFGKYVRSGVNLKNVFQVDTPCERTGYSSYIAMCAV